MHIASAIFDRSSPDLESCPDESLPEFAFIGRSNVGKSSLLNMLAGKAGLAKVSPVPGHTKLINMFTINKTWRLVDLPGYGYAQVAREQMAEFNSAVMDYLENRPNLKQVFALIDSMLPPQSIDLEFVEWLAIKSVPYVLVFTKTDRVKTGKLQTNIQLFMDQLAERNVARPDYFSCSAITGDGRRELLGFVETVLAAEGIKPQKMKSMRAAAPKPRPDRSRPW